MNRQKKSSRTFILLTALATSITPVARTIDVYAEEPEIEPEIEPEQPISEIKSDAEILETSDTSPSADNGTAADVAAENKSASKSFDPSIIPQASESLTVNEDADQTGPVEASGKDEDQAAGDESNKKDEDPNHDEMSAAGKSTDPNTETGQPQQNEENLIQSTSEDEEGAEADLIPQAALFSSKAQGSQQDTPEENSTDNNNQEDSSSDSEKEKEKISPIENELQSIDDYTKAYANWMDEVEKYKQAASEIAKAKAELNEKQKDYEKAVEEYEKLKKEWAAADQLPPQEILVKTQEEFDKLEKEYNAYQEEYNAKLSKFEQDKQNYQDNLSSIQSMLNGQSDNISQIESELADFQKKIDELQRNPDSANYASLYKEYQDKVSKYNEYVKAYNDYVDRYNEWIKSKGYWITEGYQALLGGSPIDVKLVKNPDIWDLTQKDNLTDEEKEIAEKIEKGVEDFLKSWSTTSNFVIYTKDYHPESASTHIDGNICVEKLTSSFERIKTEQRPNRSSEEYNNYSFINGFDLDLYLNMIINNKPLAVEPGFDTLLVLPENLSTDEWKNHPVSPEVLHQLSDLNENDYIYHPGSENYYTLTEAGILKLSSKLKTVENGQSSVIRVDENFNIVFSESDYETRDGKSVLTQKAQKKKDAFEKLKEKDSARIEAEQNISEQLEQIASYGQKLVNQILEVKQKKDDNGNVISVSYDGIESIKAIQNDIQNQMSRSYSSNINETVPESHLQIYNLLVNPSDLGKTSNSLESHLEQLRNYLKNNRIDNVQVIINVDTSNVQENENHEQVICFQSPMNNGSFDMHNGLFYWNFGSFKGTIRTTQAVFGNMVAGLAAFENNGPYDGTIAAARVSQKGAIEIHQPKRFPSVYEKPESYKVTEKRWIEIPEPESPASAERPEPFFYEFASLMQTALEEINFSLAALPVRPQQMAKPKLETSETPPEDPKTPPEDPKTPPEDPKTPPEDPKTPPEDPKTPEPNTPTTPESPVETPEIPKEEPVLPDLPNEPNRPIDSTNEPELPKNPPKTDEVSVPDPRIAIAQKMDETETIITKTDEPETITYTPKQETPAERIEFPEHKWESGNVESGIRTVNVNTAVAIANPAAAGSAVVSLLGAIHIGLKKRRHHR